MNRYIDANKLKRKVQQIATEAWIMKLTASDDDFCSYGCRKESE